MNTKDLINRLRDTASKGVSVWGDLQTDAAKEIETLLAERECYASAMDRMKAALAEPSEQPVIAYHYQYDTAFHQGVWGVGYNVPKNATQSFPLYRASKPAPLPELTDEEIELIGNRANYEAPAMGWNRWFARAIEQAVWEKMNGK